MLSLEQAQSAILERIRRATDAEAVPLARACERYLAEPVAARVDNPAFDNSAMDGYAVRSADLAAHAGVLPLVGASRCGDNPQALAPGSAMRIYTGAPLPERADAIVIQEDARVEPDGRVALPLATPVGNHVRHRGEDFHAGEALYPCGQRLRAFDLALLGAAGVAEVRAWRRPRALVLATGDELAAPGAPLKPGQIYESNRLPTLLQLTALGAEVTDGGIVRDDVGALRDALAVAAEYDFVITSGGASVGDHDLVKQVFAEHGDIAFWKARVKPGKPIAFGRIGERAHFFALPGNPVSSLVTFRLFVAPALAVWHHATAREWMLTATAANAFQRRPGRTEFLRARLYGDGDRLWVEALRGQGSHQLAPLAHTNALIRIEAESPGFAQGDSVRVLML